MESLGGDNGKIKPIKKDNKPHRIKARCEFCSVVCLFVRFFASNDGEREKEESNKTGIKRIKEQCKQQKGLGKNRMMIL